MPSVAELIEYIEPISAATACGALLDAFLDNPGRDILLVADGDRPQGVISRAQLQGHDVAQRAINIMTPPLVVDPSLSIEAACELLLAQRDPAPGLVLVENGRWLGVVSTRALLRRACEAPAEGENQRPMEMLNTELRGSIGGVVALAELLQRQPLTADAQAYVRTIVESSQAALRSLEDAFELSRADAGDTPPDLQPVLLRTLVDAIQTRWQARAAQDGVTLLTAYDGEPDLSGMIDPARVGQVFDRLIDAALSVNRRGVVEASLQAARTAEGLQLTGRVRDTGGGFSALKSAPALSSPTLATCERLMARFGGTLRVDDNPGAGATIVFDWTAGLAVEEASDIVSDLGGLKRAAHILVVDDNATNRMVAEALCEMFGCTSESVEDGVEAVEAAQTGRFDLILMDIRMPRMDGIQATVAIRALPGPAGQAPIIALTANADPEDTQAYLAAGMQSVVEKPLKPERLLHAINNILSDHSGKAAAAAA
jgi:CheY-like chemotaxis protein/signal transduction histidine kinase